VPELLGLPLHPAVVHFPLAGSVFAALLLAIGLRDHGKGLAYLNAAIPVLVVTLLSVPLAIWTGHAWAEASGLLPDGGWLPAASVLKGFLRRHVLLASAGSACLLITLPLAIAARNRRLTAALALVSALLGAGLLSAAGHQGGMMVHRPSNVR